MRPDTLALPWSERSLRLSTWLQENLPLGLTGGLGFGTHYVMHPTNPTSGKRMAN